MAKYAVMPHVVNLEANQLAIALQVPLAQAADARQVANLRITFMPVQITGLVMDAQNEIVKSVGTIAEQPGTPAHPRPKDTILRPALPVAFVPVTAVVWCLEPIEPLRQVAVLAYEAGKDRRKHLRKQFEWHPNQEQQKPFQVHHC